MRPQIRDARPRRAREELMQALLIFAGGLLVALGVAHSVLGEKYILIRLFRREDLPKLFGSPDFTIRTLRFAWHLTTIAWFGLGSLLIYVARGEVTVEGVLHVVATTCVISALLPLIWTRGKHLSWVIFLAVGAIAWIGA